MSPLAVISIATISVVIGAIGYSFNQGKQICEAEYEVKILQAKIDNQEKSLEMYKEADEYNKKIASEATYDLENVRKINEELQIIINTMADNNDIVVDADFLSKLPRLRQQPKY